VTASDGKCTGTDQAPNANRY